MIDAIGSSAVGTASGVARRDMSVTFISKLLHIRIAKVETT
jgi:hypothetical protein